MRLKKFWAILVTGLCLLAGAVTGCSSSAKTYTDSAQTVEVSVNDEFIIGLDSNPTTGYSWLANFDTSRVNLESDEYKANDKTAQNVVGAGGTQYFKFKALQTGSATITFRYRRPWEQPSAEDKLQTFQINIK